MQKKQKAIRESQTNKERLGWRRISTTRRAVVDERSDRRVRSSLTNMTVSSPESALDSLGDLAWSRLPCSQADDGDLGARVELEGLLTGDSGRVLRHDDGGEEVLRIEDQ